MTAGARRRVAVVGAGMAAARFAEQFMARAPDSEVVLYGADVPLGGVVLLVTTLITATCGLACVGTLYGGLTAGFSGRETLLPLLVFPVVAPVLIGATRAVESALGTGGVALAEGWPWIGLLAVFAVAFGVGGALAFGPLLETSN